MNNCRICNSRNIESFEAIEMMFGTKEAFEYEKCLDCLSLQIAKIPEDLSRFYPDNYNAYHKNLGGEDGFIKKYLKSKMANDYLSDRNSFISKIMMDKYGLGYVEKMKKSNVNLDSKILDVGTGNGARLIGLSKYGFSNLTGLEPFIEEDLHYNSGVSVLAQDIFSHEGKYDLVMFNHVYEHVVNPKKVLEKAMTLLTENGTIQISIPVADSEAYKIYGKDWVALDPPRHLHIFSSGGLTNFVKECGFTVYDSIYDSSSYQFWASEQYQKDIPLRSEKSYYTNKENSIFSALEISGFEKRAKELNEQRKGDTACFYLKKS